MSRTRDERILAALTIRINALKGEYSDLAAEIDAVGTHLDTLIADAWALHDRLVDMRATAFKVWGRTQPPPDTGREAA